MLWCSVLVLSSVLILIWIKRSHEIESKILSVLRGHSEMYGLQIADAIEQDFGRKPGWQVLYPGLRRLERQGVITARWDEEQPEKRGGARRKYYQRTDKRMKFNHLKTAYTGLKFPSPSLYTRLLLLANDEQLEQAHEIAVQHILKILEQHQN